MAIDTEQVGSDGWWLEQCWLQLREQKRACEALHKRYRGDPPLPGMNPRQKAAVRWFMGKSRTNFERLITNAVLKRMRLRGIRTVVDDDEGGDPEAFGIWKASRGKLWSREVHKMALTMSRGYIMVGRHPITGRLLVTAEDPRHTTAIADPADPLMVSAGLKLTFDPVRQTDRAYLLMPGRVRQASRARTGFSAAGQGQLALPFGPTGMGLPIGAYGASNMQSFEWDNDGVEIPGLGSWNGLDPVAPIVPFINEDGMAEFEPHLELLDRISHQILQRMTIATLQAFRQRAFMGLPQVYPKGHPQEGQKIDYEEIFVADPAAVWNVPQALQIWESGQADLAGILMSVRDDVKDLAAVSDSPLYSINPDVAAQGSAEGAALQREGITGKVESRQELWEVNHQCVDSLIFRTLGDAKRADPEKISIIWAPPDRPGWAEIGSASAQMKGIMPNYMILTKIAQLDPEEADRAMTMLTEDAANAAAAAPAAPAAPNAPPTPPQKGQPAPPAPAGGAVRPIRPSGSPNTPPRAPAAVAGA